eukprot:6785389-Pyramimonas_sp.AAC.1
MEADYLRHGRFQARRARRRELNEGARSARATAGARARGIRRMRCDCSLHTRFGSAVAVVDTAVSRIVLLAS